ncbi:hypothetical protein STRIP9103_01765, partial [Streptomyces ipomoeae 91-03]
GGRRASGARASGRVYAAPSVRRRRSRRQATPPTAARPTAAVPATGVKFWVMASPPPPAGGPPLGPAGGHATLKTLSSPVPSGTVSSVSTVGVWSITQVSRYCPLGSGWYRRALSAITGGVNPLPPLRLMDPSATGSAPVVGGWLSILQLTFRIVSKSNAAR